MKKVTGIGGIFFKSNNPEASRNWYQKHLGLNTDEYGTNFEWRQSDTPEAKGFTQWSPFDTDTRHFKPSDKGFMINFRVENLKKLLDELKKEGIEIIGEPELTEYGTFAHIMDPDGVKIELWEPDDEAYEKICGGHITK